MHVFSALRGIEGPREWACLVSPIEFQFFCFSLDPDKFENHDHITSNTMAVKIDNDWQDVGPPEFSAAALPASSFRDETARPGGTLRNVDIADEVFNKLPLTQAGIDALECIVDPFHDKEIWCDGYPDGAASRTVTEVVRRQITITAPDGLTDGQKWDCHICSTPVCATTHFDVWDSTQNCLISAYDIGADTKIGLITAVATLSGSPTWPDGYTGTEPGAGGVPLEYSTLSLTENIVPAAPVLQGYETTTKFLKDRSRLIGGGFEVHNTTPALTAGGSVTGYTQNSATEDSTLWMYPGNYQDAVGTPVDVYHQNGNVMMLSRTPTVRSPPATLDQAALIPNAVTWNAKKGSYSVLVPDSEESLKFKSPVPMNVAFLSTESSAGEYQDDATTAKLVGWSGYNIWGRDPGMPHENGHLAADANQTNGFLNSGVYYAGLDQASTLTIVARFIIERAPSPNSELVSIARPTPSPDPCLWPILKLTLAQLPPACPVDENFLGKYVKKAADVVGEILEHPSASAAMEIAGQYGGPKVQAGVATARMLKDAREMDNSAAVMQHNAAMQRERAGVAPRRAGDEYAVPNYSGRRRRGRRRRRRQITNRAVRKQRRGRR
jgi:hypothetical protein